jgi:hypothetical protein
MTRRRRSENYAIAVQHNVCPTCGSRGYARVRSGGRARVSAYRGLPWPNRQPRGAPNDSTRVYWPQQYGYAHCPDDWHRRNRVGFWLGRRLVVDGPAEPPRSERPINTHLEVDELEQRRKARARRHRDHQSKARR